MISKENFGIIYGRMEIFSFSLGRETQIHFSLLCIEYSLCARTCLIEIDSHFTQLAYKVVHAVCLHWQYFFMLFGMGCNLEPIKTRTRNVNFDHVNWFYLLFEWIDVQVFDDLWSRSDNRSGLRKVHIYLTFFDFFVVVKAIRMAWVQTLTHIFYWLWLFWINWLEIVLKQTSFLHKSVIRHVCLRKLTRCHEIRAWIARKRCIPFDKPIESDMSRGTNKSKSYHSRRKRNDRQHKKTVEKWN